MSIRRAAERRAEAGRTADAPAAPARPAVQRAVKTPQQTAPTGPRSLEGAEALYVACRDAWTAAMRAANSGRSADLASLAIAQEAYEKASAEVQRWRTGEEVAITVEPERDRDSLQAAIGQEMAWRRMHEPKPQKGGPLSHLAQKITRRG